MSWTFIITLHQKEGKESKSYWLSFYLGHQIPDQEVQAGVWDPAIGLLLKVLWTVTYATAVQYGQEGHWPLLQYELVPELEVADMLHTSLGLLPKKRPQAPATTTNVYLD